MEPGQPIRRAVLSSGVSGWRGELVAGQAPDGTEVDLVGTVHTASDIAKWIIETADGRRQVEASSLDPEAVRATHLGQRIRLRVVMRVTEHLDALPVRRSTPSNCSAKCTRTRDTGRSEAR